MRPCLYALIALLLWLDFAPQSGWAAQTARTRLGELNLRADLELATPVQVEGNESRQDFDEELLLIVHDTFLTGRHGDIVRLRDSLKQEFISTIAITLSYGQNFRRRDRDIKCPGTHAHRHEDALRELESWFQYLVRRGARSIFLAGYGRGANQVALFALTQPSPFLRGLILIDPLATDQQQLQLQFAQYGQDLSELRQQAARVLPSAVMQPIPFLGCPPATDTQVTSGSFLSYYADNANLDTLNIIPELEARSLLIYQQGLPAAAMALEPSDDLWLLDLSPDVELLGYEFNELVQRLVEFMDFY